MIWNIRVRDKALRRQLNLSLTVNPLGAFRLEGAAGIDALEATGKVSAAARVGAGEWTAEAAIPLSELSGQHPTAKTAWAVGIQRVVPGVGFQSWTAPAASEIMPEGFGLLIFQ